VLQEQNQYFNGSSVFSQVTILSIHVITFTKLILCQVARVNLKFDIYVLDEIIMKLVCIMCSIRLDKNDIIMHSYWPTYPSPCVTINGFSQTAQLTFICPALVVNIQVRDLNKK